MSYKCKHFEIRELVSPIVYQARGEKAWALLDPRLLMVLDRIVEKFGPAICNNWAGGGQRDLCGLRNIVDKPKCDKEGIWLNFGQHEAGRAADLLFLNTTVAKVREYILAHPEEFPEIKGVEIASWLHIDVRNSETREVFKV